MGIAGSSVPGSGDLVMVIQPQGEAMEAVQGLCFLSGYNSSISAKPGASGIGPEYQPRLHLQFFG